MLSMDAKDFGDAVRSVVDEVKKSSEELERMSSNGISFMAILEAIESVRKAVADLSSDFNSFDKGMRAVNTMAGLNPSLIFNCPFFLLSSTLRFSFAALCTTNFSRF